MYNLYRHKPNYRHAITKQRYVKSLDPNAMNNAYNKVTVNYAFSTNQIKFSLIIDLVNIHDKKLRLLHPCSHNFASVANSIWRYKKVIIIIIIIISHIRFPTQFDHIFTINEWLAFHYGVVNIFFNF